MNRIALVMTAFFVWAATVVSAAPVQLTPDQQAAIDKLKSRGASITQIAADTDALSVNLALAGKTATDADVALVKLLPKVTQLNLGGTAVTDAGLANIESFTGLTQLYLDRTGVTDEGMTHLKGMTSLVYLNLYATGLTDKGLEPLKGLKSLKRLYLWQSKVTDAGVASLKAAVPEVMVNRGEEMTALAAVKPADPPATPKPDDKKPAPAVADTSKPDDNGFIRTWLLLAPVPLPAGQTFLDAVEKQQVPDEAALKPKAGDKVKVGDKEVAWKTYSTPDFFFDVNQLLGGMNDNAAVYAVAYLESPAEVSAVQLAIGSDDGGRVYLNGKEVLKHAEPRGLIQDQNVAKELVLKQGVNVVVFKVTNGNGGFQGCLRLKDKDGKPITNFKVKAAP